MPSLKAMAREAQKKPKVGAPKQAPKNKQAAFKSAERVADSDLESETESESDSDSEDGSVIVPIAIAKLNGQKPMPVSVSKKVENEEEDDEEDESESQELAAASTNHGSIIIQSSDGGEGGSSEGSDSEHESEEEHEQSTARVAAEKTSSIIEEAIQAKSDKPKSVPIYNPPDGFTILSESSNGDQRVAETFSRSNLAGKQLWYITAPASIPISVVKQVSLQDIQLGKPALSLSGRNYGFVQGQAGEGDITKVLIPEGSRNAYRVGQRAVDQTLHLQQIVQLHKITNVGSQNSKLPATIAERPARKQPEGLKMRFRPIGFGKGKTGTLGFSSSSDDYASSTTDTDVDEEMENGPPVSRQPLDLDQASTRLSEHASKASERQDDTSSSGEETDDPPIVGQADTPSDSSSSPETSNGGTEDVPKSTSATNKKSSPLSRPLKRKLSDFKKDGNASNIMYEQFDADGMPPKTARIKKLGHALEVSASTVNEIAINTEKRSLSSSPSKVTQVLSRGASEAASGHVHSSKPKVTPIRPPRQSSILPPAHASRSPDVPKVKKAAAAKPEISPVKAASSQVPSEKTHRGLEDHHQSIDPLNEKERNKEIRRLKKIETSRVSKNQRRESMNSTTSDTLDRSINAPSPSRSVQQQVSESSSQTKPSVNKDLSQNTKPSSKISIEQVSKKPRKYNSNSTSHKENGATPRPSNEASATISSPRKESVILPPKFARSMSR